MFGLLSPEPLVAKRYNLLGTEEADGFMKSITLGRRSGSGRNMTRMATAPATQIKTAVATRCPKLTAVVRHGG